jgi:hypothetical protein
MEEYGTRSNLCYKIYRLSITKLGKVRSIRLHQARDATITETYDGGQVVGIDLHRRHSVIVQMTEDERKLETSGSPTARC